MWILFWLFWSWFDILQDMSLLFLCLCIMIESTSSSFLNLVDWYVNDIFLLSHDVLISGIFIMLFSFLNSVFCINHQYTFSSLKFSHVFSDYDFFILIVVFQLIFHIMIFLIIFSHSVMHIFRILMSNIDFIFLFCDIFHTHHYDMLFNVIIHMSSSFCFSWFWVFLFFVRLSHINFYLFQ